MVHTVIPLLTAAANHVELPELETIAGTPSCEGDACGINAKSSELPEFIYTPEFDEKTRFLLRRGAGREPVIWHEFLFSALLSSQAAEDLMRLNPYLLAADAEALLDAVAVVVMRANRIGHVNRCIAAAVNLSRKLDQAIKLSPEERKSRAQVLLPNFTQASEGLAGQICSKRHYVAEGAGGERGFDPRFAIFEFTWNILLRKKQVMIVDLIIAHICPYMVIITTDDAGHDCEHLHIKPAGGEIHGQADDHGSR